MEANELRLGNFVSVKKESLQPLLDDYGLHGIENSFQITSIENVYLYILTDGLESEYYLSECKPIPLTDEWLDKFGFDGWDKGVYTMILSNGNFMKIGCEEAVGKNIKHVHQLQNLYFALTGEELIIKI